MIIDVRDETGPYPEYDPSPFDILLRGRWVSSFQGHIQDDPDLLSDGSVSGFAPSPPQLGAFVLGGAGGLTQVDGFYVFSALSDLTFGFDNDINGTVDWNIGKDHQATMSVTGTYSSQMGRLGVIEGEFNWQLAGEGYSEVGIKGYYVLTRANELTWVVTGASRVAPATSPGSFRAGECTMPHDRMILAIGREGGSGRSS